MTIKASITLPNFDAQFEANVKKEIRKKIALVMPNITSAVKKRLEAELYTAISTSETWTAVTGGVLRGELGIPSVASLDAILERWASGIQVQYKRNTGFGSIEIGMLRSGYSDVLSLPQASYPYVSRRTSGIIEWLRWLLLEGTQTIVAGYDFEPGVKGRTGLGIMVRTGGGWQIPQQYAGTATDNFATRSLSDIQNVIDRVVKEEVNRRF